MLNFGKFSSSLGGSFSSVEYHQSEKLPRWVLPISNFTRASSRRNQHPKTCPGGRLKILRHVFVAFSTFEFVPEPRCPAFGGGHPFPHAERRIVPDMLIMAAYEPSPPRIFVVTVKGCDRLFHFPR
jgi:hypothetical protein